MLVRFNAKKDISEIGYNSDDHTRELNSFSSAFRNAVATIGFHTAQAFQVVAADDDSNSGMSLTIWQMAHECLEYDACGACWYCDANEAEEAAGRLAAL